MTQTVLPQLQDIASELATQEASLVAQLEEIREKLNGVRAVMPLFGEDGSLSVESFVTTPEAPAASKTASKAEPKAKSKAKTKSSTKKATTTTTTTKKAKSGKKKDGRTASWQKYTRPGVKEKTIPEAVRLVLETQPDKSFKIAEVMDSLFKDGMPKQQYLKARNRISNILSGGVRDGEWYKGERGTYGLTKTK